MMGAAETWGRGSIMPGAGPPTPRAGPARPCTQPRPRQWSAEGTPARQRLVKACQAAECTLACQHRGQECQGDDWHGSFSVPGLCQCLEGGPSPLVPAQAQLLACPVQLHAPCLVRPAACG